MSTLFGFDIFTGSKEDLIKRILNTKDKIHILSGNADVLKYALKDNNIVEKYKKDYNMVIVDGISVYIPMKIKKKINLNRITGIDLMNDLLKEYEDNNKSIYLLGAKQEILDKLVNKLNIDYPNLKIVGNHHGYIDINNCNEIISDINSSNAHTIFVAMGAPLQEKFILDNIDNLNCLVYMGVGGSFDVLSGHINRAPKWMSKVGLEWLYRLIKDPSKISRVLNNIIFTIKGCIKG